MSTQWFHNNTLRTPVRDTKSCAIERFLKTFQSFLKFHKISQYFARLPKIFQFLKELKFPKISQDFSSLLKTS